MLDLVAEKTLIKAMMNGCMDEVVDEVPVYLFQSKDAQETIRSMFDMKGLVTYNTMLQAKRFKADYIYECQSMQFDKDDIPYHIEKLKVAYVKKLGNEYIKNLNKLIVSPCSLEEITTALRNGVSVDLLEKDSRLTIMPENYAVEHYKGIVERANNPENKKGIHFKNFPELNNTFYGLQGGDLILICAQSGHGKTALALNISDDFSIDQTYTGYYANAEMRDEELTMRIASKRAIIPTQEVMSSNFIEVNKMVALEKLSYQYAIMEMRNLILSRIPVMSISSIRRGYKKLANAGKKPDYILIDYIGRMELERKDTGLSEWQKLYLLSEDIKTLAVELDIPIIALAQLNGDGQIEGAKKMKNACDGVLFFEPISDEDMKYMNQTQKDYANYKIIKFKVRRNDNSKPIYINFTKKYQRIAEVF
jgi:nucleoside-triphosphatase THEP1